MTGRGCVAQETRERRVAVMLGKCGLAVGRCDKECAHVTVVEHTACSCDCQLSSAQCDPGTHR